MSSPPSSDLTPAVSLESEWYRGVLTGALRFCTLSGVVMGHFIQVETRRPAVAIMGAGKDPPTTFRSRDPFPFSTPLRSH